ncbi:MAG: hypothetical protein ACRDD1_00570, partial [Planctomycetia bacterium]
MEVPVWQVVLMLGGAMTYMLLFGWLIKTTYFDWGELPILWQLGATAAVILMSLPLALFFRIGWLGV